MIKKIKETKIKAMKESNKEMKNACVMILGEVERNKSKNLSDDEVIKIITKLIKSELITLEYSDQPDNDYIICLKTFLPQMKTKQEIVAFVETIDFSKLKNKMMAIGLVKKEFGSTVDNSLVKIVVENREI